ncbi:MAG: AraC family transcriptional regulator [Bacteroides sp.]|nr:AraC family transcriptional regulator [Roseburia sp.]MCM1345929.1 AraC family transcriptional regulator [Bacteroides sp.]MCM1420094.1 AraC family transcriptional regulator [Bacteroides sp.]
MSSSAIGNINPLVLNIGLARQECDWNWKNVQSPFTRIYYVTEGTASIVLPDGTYTLRPNHLYMIPAFTRHSYICQSLFIHYYLHIYEEYQAESGIFDEFRLPVEVKAGVYDLLLFERLLELNPFMQLPASDPATYDNNPTLVNNIIKYKQSFLSRRIESQGIIQILIARFLEKAQRKQDSIDVRVRKSLSFIKKNIAAPLTTEYVAAEACLSKEYFIRIFKSETGTSPLKYINNKKMEKAQLMLITSNEPIKNIAFALSYDDYSYFIRLFRKTTGMTPAEFRKTNRAGCVM